MKEYTIEGGELVCLDNLEVPYISDKEFQPIHRLSVLACHDIFISYDGEILLLLRDKFPAKDTLWPVGGRIKRGMLTEKSLRLKVSEECNLELDDLVELGHARTYWKTDPFCHGKGTDTLNIVYFGRGTGELKLDNFHRDHAIVSPESYTQGFRESLHPYVRDFMDLAMPLIND